MKPFKVSVCMITYNHEKFIAQAIEGFLMQVCDFQTELIIGEDFSSDATREICIQYWKRFPDKIKLHLAEKNLGAMDNFIATIENSSKEFKYVAMCEGDDYWTDCHKLQKQVDYLEANPDCGLVYTDVAVFDDKTNIFLPTQSSTIVPDDMMVNELIKQKFIHFPSIMVRKKLLSEIMIVLIPELHQKIIADTRLILEFAQRAKIGYLPFKTTVYRIVEGSASHPKSIEKYIFANRDSYDCRKNFVMRHNLDLYNLGIPVCNFNRALINFAMIQSNYLNSITILKNIKIEEIFLYCDWKTFRKKMDAKTIIKLFSSILGISAIRNQLRK